MDTTHTTQTAATTLDARRSAYVKLITESRAARRQSDLAMEAWIAAMGDVGEHAAYEQMRAAQRHEIAKTDAMLAARALYLSTPGANRALA